MINNNPGLRRIRFIMSIFVTFTTCYTTLAKATELKTEDIVKIEQSIEKDIEQRPSMKWRIRFFLNTDAMIVYNSKIEEEKYLVHTKQGKKVLVDKDLILNLAMQKYNPAELKEMEKNGGYRHFRKPQESIKIEDLDSVSVAKDKLIVIGATWCAPCKITLSAVVNAVRKKVDSKNLDIVYLEFGESNIHELPLVQKMAAQGAVDFKRDWSIPFIAVVKNGKLLNTSQANEFLSHIQVVKSKQDLNKNLEIKKLISKVILTSVLTTESDAGVAILTKYPFAGYLVYRGNSSDSKNTQNLKDFFSKLKNNNSQNQPFIAVDQEGGRYVQRIVAKDICTLPAPKNLKGQPTAVIKRFAEILTRDLLRAGVNMNLAPVLDLENQKNIDVTGWGRTYSADVNEVIRIANILNSVMRENGLLTVAKHLPGIGDTKDTHTIAEDITKSIDELRGKELKPFIELAKSPQGLTGMMLGHVRLTQLDQSTILAYSPRALKGLVADTLKFDGLIINDAFHMGAATKYESEEVGLYKAILAGVAPVYTDSRYVEAALNYVVSQVTNPQNKEEAERFFKVLEHSIKRVEWAQDQIGKVNPKINLAHGCSKDDQDFLNKLSAGQNNPN